MVCHVKCDENVCFYIKCLAKIRIDLVRELRYYEQRYIKKGGKSHDRNPRKQLNKVPHDPQCYL